MNTFRNMTTRFLRWSIPICVLALSACPDRIVFESRRAIDGTDALNGTNWPNGSNIWRVNDDGTGPTAVTKPVNAYSHEARWSPDGAQIVFSSNRALDGTDAQNMNSISNIWRVNADGTNPTPVTKSVKVFSSGPSWSPDGTHIVFSSDGALDGTDAQNIHRQPNIWRVNSDGASPTPLTKGVNAWSTDPSWSPDGTQILFGSGRALDGTDAANIKFGTLEVIVNIWRVNADGTNPTPVTKEVDTHSYEATWSPDGAQIVFSSDRALAKNDTLNIWRVNADGTNPTPVTKTVNVNNSNPRWSPDGAQIVFSSNRALDGTDQFFNFNIWRVNADGTNPTPVTKAVNADSFEPTWAPDGAQIVFSSNRALDRTDAKNKNDTWNIWRVNADGTNPTPLTNTTAQGADSLRPEFYRPVSRITGPLNSCGGRNVLFKNPGFVCREANRCGRWRCLGTEALTCDTQVAQDNGCGGCAPLPPPESGIGVGAPCIVQDAAQHEGILVCAKGGDSLICCPFGTAGIGCGQGNPPP
jgi:Tol biopolymer transport system component